MKPLLTVLLLTTAVGCTSAGGMLRVQAGLWKGGAVAHLQSSRPPAPAEDASAAELAAYGNWQRAVLIAASTVCTEDQRQKLKATPACKCADEGVPSPASCDAFLGGAAPAPPAAGGGGSP